EHALDLGRIARIVRWQVQRLVHHLFNSSNYRNEEIETLVDETLHLPTDDPGYAPKVKRMFEIAFEDLPRIPLWQPALNVATNGAEGYEYWFHRQLDARGLSKA
ncbi:MAG: hypothetical protein AAF074_23045, partial [Pseudomonadota bacterium]